MIGKGWIEDDIDHFLCVCVCVCVVTHCISLFIYSTLHLYLLLHFTAFVLHLWLDAKLHFVVSVLVLNKVESNLIRFNQ